MHRRMTSVFALGVMLLLLLAAVLMATQAGAAFGRPLAADDEVGAYLPLIFVPEPNPTPTITPTPEPTLVPSATPIALEEALVNGSFEDRNWLDLDVTKQQPPGWELSWVEPGDLLYDDDTNEATGECECVHKLLQQLPENERPGGSDPLILDGEVVYKLFAQWRAFGTELRQDISGLEPGVTGRLTVPIRVHLHGDYPLDPTLDPKSAQAGVWVNGLGQWVLGSDSGDRTWFDHVVEFVVPEDGAVEIVIRVKSRWGTSKDFFVDDIRLETIAPAPTLLFLSPVLVDN